MLTDRSLGRRVIVQRDEAHCWKVIWGIPVESRTEPEHGAKNALKSTEIIFACWESARRRGMVELPLDIEDNPLVAMVESGDLKPAKREA